MPPSGAGPRILITVRRLAHDAPADVVDRHARSLGCYTDAVREAGGEPHLVAPGDPMPDRYDGVLLAGGADVHPRHFGQPIHEAVGASLTIDEARDALELEVARRALDDDVPVLGICRGVQVLNVAAGGTVWQDLSLAGIDPADHDQHGRLEAWELGHDVVVEQGSRLAEIVGEGVVGVNTFHHQAVDLPARGFLVTARAPDGTVEGLESRCNRFALGVQWHPERLVTHHPLHRRLFAALVNAARDGRGR